MHIKLTLHVSKFILVGTSVVPVLSVVVVGVVTGVGGISVVVVTLLVVAIVAVVAITSLVLVGTTVLVALVAVAITEVILLIFAGTVGTSIVGSSAMTAKLDKWLDKHLTAVELTIISVVIPSLDQLVRVSVLYMHTMKTA